MASEEDTSLRAVIWGFTTGVAASIALPHDASSHGTAGRSRRNQYGPLLAARWWFSLSLFPPDGRG